MDSKPENSGDPASNKRKRKTIDLEQKLAIVRHHQAGQMVSSLARTFNLSKSTVSTIVKDSARIMDAVKGTTPLKATIITQKRKGPIQEMEKLLLIWMEDHIRKRIPLSLPTIQAKALSLFEDLKKKEGGDYEQNFNASNGWFNRFKKRVRFHYVEISGEVSSVDEQDAEKFREELEELIVQENFLPEQIFNVDETCIMWRKLPDHTNVHMKTEPMPGSKEDKITLLLGGNVAGHKLKPFLICHNENQSTLVNVNKASLPVHFRLNSRSLMTYTIFEDWFISCFIPEVETYCMIEGIPFNILLILVDAPSHLYYLNDLHPNVGVVFMPPNTTSLIQPMEQGVIVNFKALYLQKVFGMAIAATGNNKQTLREFWEGYSIIHAICNISDGWEEVSKQCVKCVWKKLLTRYVNDFQGFDEEKELEDISEELVFMAKELNLEVEKEDIVKLIEAGEGELSNEDLIELEAARVAEEEKLKEENQGVSPISKQPRTFSVKKLALAFNKINEGLQMIESMDSNVTRFKGVERKVHDALACYK